jgi:hypothetical protein
LGGDPLRRCYGFFHAELPDEPLVFIEVALTQEIPANIASVIPPIDTDSLTDANLGSVQQQRPPSATFTAEQATTAVFYSINSTQAGMLQWVVAVVAAKAMRQSRLTHAMNSRPERCGFRTPSDKERGT